MNCKVSVIVPVYNSSKYLYEMADSLIKQSLNEMEFIFVDDCSKDDSLKILYDIEKKDPDRVIVVKCDQNQGPGGARNIGLQYANGEYIGFVDSDDFINKDMYKYMYDKAVSGNYDIVECGYYSERHKKNMMLWDKGIEGNVSFENRVKMIMTCGFIWSKLYKKRIIFNSEIYFAKRIPLEDIDFLSRIYCRVSRVGIIDKTLYYYRDNSDSFSRKRNNQSFFDINNIFSQVYLEHMKREKEYNILKPVIEYVVIDVWFDTFKSYVKNNSNIHEDALKYINNQIKKYIKNYNENIFFVEKAKVDKLVYAFLINSQDSMRAIKILNMTNK